MRTGFGLTNREKSGKISIKGGVVPTLSTANLLLEDTAMTTIGRVMIGWRVSELKRTEGEQSYQ